MARLVTLLGHHPRVTLMSAPYLGHGERVVPPPGHAANHKQDTGQSSWGWSLLNESTEPRFSTTAVIPNILHCSFQKYIPACQTMWLRFLFGNTATVIASQCLCHYILGGIKRSHQFSGTKWGRLSGAPCWGPCSFTGCHS